MSAADAFAGLKTLKGEWISKTDGVHVTYDVVSGGNALVETLEGMVSVYHLDGDSVLMTHYCSSGNQPRLRAVKFPSSLGVLDFQFVDITNLRSGEHHINGLKFEFLGPDHVRETWTSQDDAGQPTIFDLKRVK
jgi:hypothetical protein